MDDPYGIAAVITALTALIGAVVKLILDLRKNTATTNNTNELVNNNHDELTARLNQLERTIVTMGGTVPVDPGIAAAQERIARHGEVA